MPTIWIPNASTHDFTAAEKYGDLYFLISGKINRFATSKYYRDFADAMKNSSKDDFLLTTGLTVLNIIATAILISKHGQINLLIFKTQKGQKSYLERIIKINE